MRIALPAQIPFLVASVLSNDTAIIAMTLVGLFTGLIASGAVTYAVTRYYLGHPVGAADSYVGAMNNGVSLLANGLLFAGAVFGGIALSLLIIGIPVLVFILVALFFYVQAVVIENKAPVDALGRSWQLVRGLWWRTFFLGIAFVLVVVVIGLVLSLPGLAVSLANPTLGDFLATLAGVFVAPIGSIGATLVYFDLRARKEGLTLSRLAKEIGLTPSGPPSEGPGRPL